MQFFNDSKSIYKIPNEEKIRIVGIIFILSVITFLVLIIELIIWNKDSTYKNKLEPIGYSVLIFIVCVFLFIIIFSRSVNLYESPNTLDRNFNLYSDTKSNLIIWFIFTLLSLLVIGDIWLGKKRLKGINFTIIPFFILIFVTITSLFTLMYIVNNDLQPDNFKDLTPSVINNKLRNMEKDIYGNAAGLEDAIEEAQKGEIDEDKKNEILEKAYLLDDSNKENFISNPEFENKNIIYRKEYDVNGFFSLKEPDPEFEYQGNETYDDEKNNHIKLLLKSGYKKN